MSKVTLEAIEQLFDQKMDEKLEPLITILTQHTSALEILLSNHKTKSENETVAAHRLDHLEHWADEVGQKVGIKLKL